jgi:hypothetical protein
MLKKCWPLRICCQQETARTLPTVIERGDIDLSKVVLTGLGRRRIASQCLQSLELSEEIGS